MSRSPKNPVSTKRQTLPKPAAISALFHGALSAHQAGRLVEAQNGYIQVLSVDARHADASHLLGIVHLQRGHLPEAEVQIRKALAVREDAFALGNLGNLLQGNKRLAEAEPLYRRALELKPDFAEAHYNLGVLLKSSDRPVEAETAFRAAVKFKPDSVDAHYNLGTLLKSSGCLAEAEVAFRRSLVLKPDHAEAHNDLGVLLSDCKRLSEAESAFRRALELKHDFADAHHNLGILLQDSKRPIEAEAAYRRALELKSDHADAHNNLGALLRDSKRLPEAEAAFRLALGFKHDFAAAHYNLGLLLQDSKRLTEAEAAYRRALEIKPDHADVQNNLGALLRNSKRLSEAEAALRRALELDPNHADAHNNLGVLLYDSRRVAEAEASLRLALELKRNSAEARFQLSLLLLALQRYHEAWPLYESRYAPAMGNVIAKIPDLSYPQWQGESLDGKSLVIWTEQGYGDCIQFARYIPMIKARGVRRLTLMCPQPLVALIETVEGVDAVVTDQAQLPAHDYWSFILSLPLRFATTAVSIPLASLPYMHALPLRVAQWRDRLPASAGCKVGLVWKGSSLNQNDSNRSLPNFASLAPLWAVPGVTFISLQKGQGEEEVASPSMRQPLVALGAGMSDFADAAAIVSQLDLIICVDTAIAHLAGAMGKPCWVLLPAMSTDWRWQLDRTDSPWYPSIRLFRQTDLEDWSQTIDEVADALKTWSSLQGMSRSPEILVPIKKQISPTNTNTNALFQDALSAHQAGRLAEAETGYRQVLSKEERHADALPLLGLVHLQRGNLVEGEQLIRKALAVREDAFFQGCLADILRQSERLPAAEAAYRRALKIKPDYAEAHNNQGILLYESKRLPEAEAAYRCALEFKPDYADAHYNLGNLLNESKRFPEAEAAYRYALEIRPDYAEVHSNLGNLLYESKRVPAAEMAYRRALEIKPGYAEAHNNLGILLNECKRVPEAEAAYRRALEIKPDDADAHNNLGMLLNKSKRLPEAEAAYRRALKLKPNYPEAHSNLGNLLKESKRLPEAEAAYRRALEIKPDYAEAHSNLGNLLKESKRLPEAEVAYRRALEIKPDYADARFNLSLGLLSVQRYAEAWQLYESRYAPAMTNVITKIPDLSYPQWQGESLAGKSLVIWPEQGFGDYIQFVRYAFLLKARGVTRLTLVCAPPLSVLLATVEGVDAVVTDMAQLPPHDYWSFVMSLPLHCATTADTIPVAPMPYVHALPSRVAQWRDRLPAAAGLKVGLVWKGNSNHKNDANRSLPALASLAPLWSVPGVNFVSLQKGQGEEEASQAPVGQAIVALGAQMEDFADSAAIVSQLDLVICVDTAIAHVAGALGRPCWLLLPAFGTDWRWQLDRADSPWYPSVRLFRQSDLQDWSATVDEVARALKTWASVQY